MLEKLKKAVNTRLGYVILLIVLYWAKSLFAYVVDFNLDIENWYQIVVAFFNPIAAALLLIGLSLFIRSTKAFYIVSSVVYVLLSILLYANATYFREFTDFITINTMLASSKVSAGLGESALNLLRWTDAFYFLDFIVLAVLFIRKKITLDPHRLRIRAAASVFTLAIALFSSNLFAAEIDRPELLSRGFSNTYLVRYLGVPAFTIYDAINTVRTNQVRNEAKPSDVKQVEDYVEAHYAAPNPKYYGIAKGRNVIVIHLESLQQFVIDFKLKASDGKAYEVTPFLNSLFHSKETFAFDNFFHQVKAGKTSDAETLMENSFFGLSQGSFFVSNGGKNTFQAAPDILDQEAGYTSAVFHGNTGAFWNRNKVYQRFGYDYFFDKTYFDVNASNSFQYGLHDKYMFNGSVKYLEHLQQPFYTKFIAVSNHYPYVQFEGDEAGFPLADTEDKTINGYFATANYLDQSVKEFFDYLKATGVYENSMIVLYGDHYGISNARNPKLASLLGKDEETWSNYDDAMLQRVPYMVVVPGQENGGINHTYGGEVDNLPTLLHLLGIDSRKYAQLGQDMLSPERNNMVALRTTDYFVAPDYTSYAGKIYKTDTGEEVTNPLPDAQAKIDNYLAAAEEQLKVSDALTTGDLLRFWTKDDLKPIDPSDFVYTHGLEKAEGIEKDLGDKSTSIYSENGDKSTQLLFKNYTYKQLHPEQFKEEKTSTSSDTSTSTSTK